MSASFRVATFTLHDSNPVIYLCIGAGGALWADFLKKKKR